MPHDVTGGVPQTDFRRHERNKTNIKFVLKESDYNFDDADDIVFKMGNLKKSLQEGTIDVLSSDEALVYLEAEDSQGLGGRTLSYDLSIYVGNEPLTVAEGSYQWLKAQSVHK